MFLLLIKKNTCVFVCAKTGTANYFYVHSKINIRPFTLVTSEMFPGSGKSQDSFPTKTRAILLCLANLDKCKQICLCL